MSGSIPSNLITKLNNPDEIEKVLLMLANISPSNFCNLIIWCLDVSAVEFKEIFSDYFIK